MKLRVAFLVGLLVGTTFVVARRFGFDGLSHLNRAMRFATTWIERGQRIPKPTLATPIRASLARGGGALDVKRVTARIKEEIPLDVESPVIALAEHDGTLYLGTFDEGAYRLPADGGEAEQLAVDLRVNDLAVGKDGTLWVATADGAWRSGEETTRVASGAYTAAAIWKDAPVFASRRGVTFLEDGGPRTVGPEHGLAADSPDALADCGDRLCVGATDGLWLFDGTTATRHSSGSDELPTDWVTAAAFDGRLIWAGTFDGGLAALGEGGARRFSPEDGLPDGRVFPHAMTVVNGAVYVGTATGLLVLRGGTALGVDVPLPAPITAVAPAEAGGVWIGYEGGAMRLSIDEGDDV